MVLMRRSTALPSPPVEDPAAVERAARLGQVHAGHGLDVGDGPPARVGRHPLSGRTIPRWRTGTPTAVSLVARNRSLAPHLDGVVDQAAPPPARARLCSRRSVRRRRRPTRHRARRRVRRRRRRGSFRSSFPSGLAGGQRLAGGRLGRGDRDDLVDLQQVEHLPDARRDGMDRQPAAPFFQLSAGGDEPADAGRVDVAGRGAIEDDALGGPRLAERGLEGVGGAPPDASWAVMSPSAATCAAPPSVERSLSLTAIFATPVSPSGVPGGRRAGAFKGFKGASPGRSLTPPPPGHTAGKKWSARPACVERSVSPRRRRRLPASKCTERGADRIGAGTVVSQPGGNVKVLEQTADAIRGFTGVAGGG